MALNLSSPYAVNAEQIRYTLHRNQLPGSIDVLERPNIRERGKVN